MEVLLVERDPLVRDQVKVGLQQFSEFTVHVGEGYQGINELRQRPFDCIFLGVDPRDQETVRLMQHLRSFDKTTELVVLTQGRSIKDLSAEKAKWNIHSFLQTPIDVREFFGFLGRFLERRTDRDNGKIRKSASKSVSGIRR